MKQLGSPKVLVAALSLVGPVGRFALERRMEPLKRAAAALRHAGRTMSVTRPMPEPAEHPQPRHVFRA